MNKADLIEALAPRLGGRGVATQAVESFVDLVLREVAAGGSVVVTGFGTFETVERAARTGRNPRTGEAVPISATSSPRFRPAAYFKDVVTDPARLPKDGLAGVRVAGDGAAPPREGAPPTVRRGSQPEAPTTRRARTSRAAAPPASDQPSGPRTTPAKPSGTPSTVRATTPAEPPAEPAAEETTPRNPGLVAGGEEITRGMIDAKKAQLARVKSDEVSRSGARKDRKKGAKDKSKAKDKGKGKAKEKGKGRKG